MTKQAAKEDKDFQNYLKKVQALKDAQKATENAYIAKKALYPVGAKVKLDNFNGEYDAEIISYKIEKNGEVRPSFIDLATGRRIFDHNSEIRGYL